MKDQSFNNPAEAAAYLAKNPDTSVTPIIEKVCLGSKNFNAFLTWSATLIGKHDWIGLYKNNQAKDEDHMSDWQWAKKGNSFETSIPLNTGYQARYLKYDAVKGKYVSVARTEEYPKIPVLPTVCSK